jgi:hypothetical protein
MKKSMRKVQFLTGLLSIVALLLVFSSATGASVLNPRASEIKSGFYQFGQTEYQTIRSGKAVPYELNGTSGESAVLIVRTRTGYIPGLSTVQDGISKNISEFFSPIPEPGFYGVLAIGLAMTLWAAKFRFKQKT